MACYAPEALGEALGITMIATRADLRAARDWVPRRIRPFNARAVRHNANRTTAGIEQPWSLECMLHAASANIAPTAFRHWRKRAPATNKVNQTDFARTRAARRAVRGARFTDPTSRGRGFFPLGYKLGYTGSQHGSLGKVCNTECHHRFPKPKVGGSSPLGTAKQFQGL
jgi:hypothetical protein